MKPQQFKTDMECDYPAVGDIVEKEKLLNFK